MPKITNMTNATMNFIVAGQANDGVLPTVDIKAGETKDVAVNEDSVQFQGLVAAGAIVVATSPQPASPVLPAPKQSKK